MALWTPLNLEDDGTTKVALLDAGDASTFTKDTSNYITQWVSKGKIALTAVAAAGTAPVYQANARNGKPGVYIANGAYLQFNSADLALAAFCYAVSGQLDASIPNFYTMRAFSFGDGYNGSQLIRNGSGKIGETSQNLTGVNDWGNLDQFVMLMKPASGGTSSLWVNDTQEASVAAGGSPSGNVGYIGRGQDYADNWVGVFQSILFMNRVPTTAERQQIAGWDSWATGKNGANLATANPYRTAAPTTGSGGGASPTSRRRPMILLAS